MSLMREPELTSCVASPVPVCSPASTSSRPCTSPGELPTPRSGSKSLSLSPPPNLCAACPAAKQKKLFLNINHFYNLFVNLQQTSCRDMKTSPPETHLHLNCISLIVVVHFGNIVQHLKKKK